MPGLSRVSKKDEKRLLTSSGSTIFVKLYYAIFNDITQNAASSDACGVFSFFGRKHSPFFYLLLNKSGGLGEREVIERNELNRHDSRFEPVQ